MTTEADIVETILKRGHNQSGINPADCKYVLEAFVALRTERDAAKTTLKDIHDTIASGDRPTVNDRNAFQHFTSLNRTLVGIRTKARDALALLATEGDNG